MFLVLDKVFFETTSTSWGYDWWVQFCCGDTCKNTTTFGSVGLENQEAVTFYQGEDLGDAENYDFLTSDNCFV